MEMNRKPRPIAMSRRDAFVQAALSRRDDLAKNADALGVTCRVPSRSEVYAASWRVAATGTAERIDIGMPFMFTIDTVNW